MTAYASRSFMLSALLHGLILAIVLFFLMPVRQPQAPISPSAFVLLPEAPSSLPPAQAHPSISPVTFTPPLVPVRVTTPQAQEMETSPEAATPLVRTSVVHRPAVVAPPTSQYAPPRMTMEEFRKLHPDTATPPSGNQHTPLKPARINMDTALTPAGGATLTESVPSASDIRDADVYLARLLAKLRAAHKKPAELGAGLRVRVEFSLRADGSLADVRVLESSGNREFDDSVVAAFRKVVGLGVPPKNFSKTNRVVFRTDAEDN